MAPPVNSNLKTVFAHEVTDDNIVEAINEHWIIKPSKEKMSEEGDSPFYLLPWKMWIKLVQTYIVEDPRDYTVFNTSLLCLVAPLHAFIMFKYGVSWYNVIGHLVLLLVMIRRFVLALHVSSHKSIYTKGFFSNMNAFLPGFMAPFYGQMPYTYFWHHLKMHHLEDNAPTDTSSTLFYQRDSLWHFICYFMRFTWLTIFEVSYYFILKQWYPPAVYAVLVEWSFTFFMWYNFYISFNNWAISPFFQAFLVSFYMPYNIVRFGMMQGNWTQHAFLTRSDPLGGGLHNAITVIHSWYNRVAFNDGYHASHHLHPQRHYLDHPPHLLANRKTYFDAGSICFRDTTYDDVWFMLMTKNYDALADLWVHLGDKDTKRPAKEEIIQMLKLKTKIFTKEEIDIAMQAQKKKK